MGRLADLVTLRLSRGRFGRLVRRAVREQPYVFGDPRRVRIAENVVVNDTLFNTVAGWITIEREAFFGHGVSLLAGAHDITRTGLERQRAVTRGDIVVGEGAWIASNVTVLGPCRIGRNAVVAAGAVVTKDVPPDSIVAGVPAKVIGTVERGDR